MFTILILLGVDKKSHYALRAITLGKHLYQR